MQTALLASHTHTHTLLADGAASLLSHIGTAFIENATFLNGNCFQRAAAPAVTTPTMTAPAVTQ